MLTDSENLTIAVRVLGTQLVWEQYFIPATQPCAAQIKEGFTTDLTGC